MIAHISEALFKSVNRMIYPGVVHSIAIFFNFFLGGGVSVGKPPANDPSIRNGVVFPTDRRISQRQLE